MQVTLNKAKFVDVLSKIGKISKTTVFYNNKGLYVQSNMGESIEFLNIQLNEDSYELVPFGVESSSLLDIVKTMPTDDISLEVKDEILEIKDDKKDYTLRLNKNVMPSSVEFKITEGISMNMDILLKYMPYVKLVTFYSKNENNIPIKFHENIMMATDSRRLYRIRLPEDLKFFEPTFIFSLNQLFEGDIICCKTDKRLVFAKDHNYYSIQLAAPHTIDTDKFFKDYKDDQKIKVNKLILDDINNALLIAKNEEGFKITVEILDDKMKISTSNDFGTFETTHKCVEGKGKIILAVNGDYLKQALEFIFNSHKEAEIMFKDSTSGLYIAAPNKEIEALLMPIRL